MVGREIVKDGKLNPESSNYRNHIPLVIITPTSGVASLRLRDLWEYRELLYFMVWRDIKGRYRQMAFGPLWIMIAPIIQMVLYSVLFGAVFGLPSEGIAYPIFVYVALLPWQFFSSAARQSSGSLVSQQHIISKVYFPRLLIPISSIFAAFIDFLASFLVLMGMMVVFRVPLTWTVSTLPLFLLIAGGLGLGIGLWLAGLAVKYHDVNIAVGFGIDIWKYATPVAYSVTLIPQQYLNLYFLNPMAVVVEGFRWALLGTTGPPVWSILVAIFTVTITLISGAFFFRRIERTIVDLI